MRVTHSITFIGFNCPISRLPESCTVKFVGEEGLNLLEKSARKPILGIIATEEAFDAVRQIEASNRYEFR